MEGPHILVAAEHADLDRLMGALAGEGLWARRLESADGAPRLIEVEARSRAVDTELLRRLPGVAHVSTRPSAHPLVDAHAGHAVELGGVARGPGCTAGAHGRPLRCRERAAD